jgi:hypothetical protein
MKDTFWEKTKRLPKTFWLAMAIALFSLIAQTIITLIFA